MKMSKKYEQLQIGALYQAYFVFEDAREYSGIDQSLCMNDM